MRPTTDTLLHCPTEPAAFERWLRLEDAVPFLVADERGSDLCLYLSSAPYAFIHGVLVPRKTIEAATSEELLEWNFNASASWGITTSLRGHAISIEPPLSNKGPLFSKAEQLVYVRHFDGLSGNKSYFDILQRFVHVSDIHFTDERQAYCRLNELGDLEDVVRIVELGATQGKHSGRAIYCNRDVLDEYMLATKTVLYRTFDLGRFRFPFGGWPHPLEVHTHEKNNCFYRQSETPGYASYMRGVQLVWPRMTVKQLAQKFAVGSHSNRQYASFLIHDFKNKKLVEVSCDPSATSNNFMESDAPFELSPAFFRPEVLAKYKADTEKYTVRDRSIICRGAWQLRSYDINEEGQVHAYLVDLRSLPYNEQVYWKSFNEAPKGAISKRAITSDFEGSWELDYHALNSLKEVLQDADSAQCLWWKVRSDSLWDKIQYPATNSPDEWAEALLLLDQLLVEGFENKWLKQHAEALNQKPEKDARSLTCLELCLRGLGYDEPRKKEVMRPFRELHELRSKVKGHAGNREASKIRKETLKEHGSYRQHFIEICRQCDESFREIYNVL